VTVCDPAEIFLRERQVVPYGAFVSVDTRVPPT